jgi:citrate lyase subunit beta/citryl-CoA lyase
MKPLRSILYSPGHKTAMIEKAPSYGADALCLVLEDSVPDALKAEARGIVAESIGALVAQGQTVFVKVNPLDGRELELDIEAITRPGLAGVVLPKVRTADDVRKVDALFTDAEARKGVEPGSIKLLVLVETPRAAVDAFRIASASPRVATLVVGTAAAGDMARELGFRWTAEGLERLYLRSKIVIDARAAGAAAPLDGIWSAMDDLDGLVTEASFARQLGYGGKLVVHPKHVEAVNRVFTPSAEEIHAAEGLLAAFDEALANGSAAAVIDGQFVDYAMASTARRLLELAERAGARSS